MKRQWNGGVERKANPLLRECWTFLIFEVWEDSGGGGAGGSFTQTYIWAGWISMTTHINFQLWLRRGFYLRRSKFEGQQKPGDVSLKQPDYKVIMLTAPLTLRASYLPLPPFSSSPFSHTVACPLSPSACYTAHGIQGCFKTTFFDKNYWHFIFAINPSSLLPIPTIGNFMSYCDQRPNPKSLNGG